MNGDRGCSGVFLFDEIAVKSQNPGRHEGVESVDVGFIMVDLLLIAVVRTIFDGPLNSASRVGGRLSYCDCPLRRVNWKAIEQAAGNQRFYQNL